MYITKYVWCPLSWGPKHSFDMAYVGFLVAYCCARTPEVLIPNLMQAERLFAADPRQENGGRLLPDSIENVLNLSKSYGLLNPVYLSAYAITSTTHPFFLGISTICI